MNEKFMTDAEIEQTVAEAEMDDDCKKALEDLRESENTPVTTSNQKGKKHRNGIAVLIGNIEDRCEQFPEFLKCAETDTHLEFLRTKESEFAERQKTSKADRLLEIKYRGIPPEDFKKQILRHIEAFRRANPDVKVAI